ncbi:MAG: CRISPR-associated protein Cas5 [Candidatus Heimdallarchaeota archaeon]|nr:CRISPR-associated protein Cas5 [Candidatus Heimdallarchaeota archaeon]
MEMVYAKLVGISASFRVPSFVDGDQLSLPTPSYATILGILSAAADRLVSPKETGIGFSYHFKASGKDLEKFHRYKRSSSGGYTYDATNIRRREFHIHPELELYLSNTSFFDILDYPAHALSLGRSQDIASIAEVKLIEVSKVDHGTLSGTLLPVELGKPIPCNGLFYNLPEYFDYKEGLVRKPKKVKTFLALPGYPQKISFPKLYQIKDSSKEFYLHELGE